VPRTQRPLERDDPVSRFAGRLRAARAQAGLTVRQLASTSGYGRSTLSLAESGARLPAWDVTEAFVRACGGRDISRWRGWWEAAAESTVERGPQQLPAEVAGFVGRTEALAELDALLAAGVPAVAISGAAGIGKTSLAVHWAHRRGDRFPDGRLYVNLRGFTGDQEMTSAEAIRGFLDALGVAPAELPSGPEAQAARYRALVRGRRLLVVIDNARDPAQVRPLLTAAFTVVTSRNQLTGLIVTDGARPLVLDVLPMTDSRALLTARLGTGDPAALDQIARLCAGLPLALSIVAARARQSGFPLPLIAAELAADHPLDALTAGDAATDLRTVFSWSYAALSEPAARLFRLLSVGTGPDLSGAAAAVLAGSDASAVRRLLTELVGASLVTTPAPDRYVLHDLVRAYAQSLLSEPERRAGASRLLDHYAAGALAVSLLMQPHRDPIPIDPIAGRSFPGLPAATEWLATEYVNLLAAVRQGADLGLDAQVYQIVWGMNLYLRQRGDWRDWNQAWRFAREAARRMDHPAARALAERGLATADVVTGRPDDALRRLRRALAFSGDAGDLVGQAQTHLQICHVRVQTHDPQTALDHAHQAMALFEGVGDDRGMAGALNAAGWCLVQLGDHRGAIEHCERAVAPHRQLNHPYGEALDLDSLGLAHSRLGEHDAAIRYYERTVVIYRDADDRLGEARALIGLADAFAAAGRSDLAQDARQSAHDTLTALGHPAADAVLLGKGSTIAI